MTEIRIQINRRTALQPPIHFRSLRAWLDGFALSFSAEEIIAPWKMTGVKQRRKLTLTLSRRYKYKPNTSLVCKAYHETAPGVWTPFKNMGKSGTIVWKTGDIARAREEPTSRAIVRHWKVWRGERILTASFLRIGPRSGVYIMSPGGEVATICKPPMESEPLATVDFYRPNKLGFLDRTSRPNPERAIWDEWATTIASVRAYVDEAVRQNRVANFDADVNLLPECTECGRAVVAVNSIDPWRIVYGLLWCPDCYRTMGTHSTIG